jgi:hypothetical protein
MALLHRDSYGNVDNPIERRGAGDLLLPGAASKLGHRRNRVIRDQRKIELVRINPVGQFRIARNPRLRMHVQEAARYVGGGDFTRV